MNQKNNGKILSGLVFVIIFLVASAVFFSLYATTDRTEIKKQTELTSEETKAQISLEIKDVQTSISDSVQILGEKIRQAQEETPQQALQLIYYVRVNHTQDVELFLKTQITPTVSQDADKKFSEDMLRDISVRIYDETDELEMYEGNLADLTNQILPLSLETTAAQKNDTRFRIYLRFYDDAENLSEYAACAADLKFTWYVDEAQKDALRGSQMPSLKIILYAFLFTIVVVPLLMLVFRKKINMEYLSAPDRKEDSSDDSDLQ